MGRVTGPETVRTLLGAGYDILAEEGLSKLTLDGVVARTKLTKGALIHHFKSKDELAQRLLEDAVSEFDALLAQHRGDDVSPGSYTRAYLKAVLALPRDAQQRRIFCAISELSRYGAAAAIGRKAVRRWSKQIQNDGLDPAFAQIVRLAADGLWANETSGAGQPLDAALRPRVAAELLRLATP